jgi:hypothetical protein
MVESIAEGETSVEPDLRGCGGGCDGEMNGVEVEVWVRGGKRGGNWIHCGSELVVPSSPPSFSSRTTVLRGVWRGLVDCS